MQGAVVVHLCRQFFPGLIALNPQTSNHLELFNQAAINVMKRQLGPTKHHYVRWSVAHKEGRSDDIMRLPVDRSHDATGNSYVEFGEAENSEDSEEEDENPVINYIDGKVIWRPPHDTYFIIDYLKQEEKLPCHSDSAGVDGNSLRKRSRIWFRPQQLQGCSLLKAVSDKLAVFDQPCGIDSSRARYGLYDCM